jgi:hypothetical protein
MTGLLFDEIGVLSGAAFSFSQQGHNTLDDQHKCGRTGGGG